jgi:hypothetical protein
MGRTRFECILLKLSMNFAFDLITTGLLLLAGCVKHGKEIWISWKEGDFLILGVTMTSTRQTVCCLLYTVYCLMYTVYRILDTVYCILHTVYCIPYTVYCILYTASLRRFRVFASLTLLRWQLHFQLFTILPTLCISVEIRVCPYPILCGW